MNFKNISFQIYFFLGVAFFSLNSCEDVIEVDIDPAGPQLVVDAWLTGTSTDQLIRLTQSQPYFDNTAAAGLTGASVKVTRNDGTVFEFVDQNNGDYVWTPPANTSLGDPGNSFTLRIDTEDKSYTANSTMFPTPRIDSITYEFRDDELGGPDGIYAEFYARDLTGVGNTYWIKAFKNGDFLNKPQEINIAFDAGFSAGAPVDGLIFITPIREAINRIPDEDGDDNNDVAPWKAGDVIRVEIHSINQEIFNFMTVARNQMTNGDNTIFASPLANSQGNVKEVGTENFALGVFNVGMVSSLEETVVE